MAGKVSAVTTGEEYLDSRVRRSLSRSAVDNLAPVAELNGTIDKPDANPELGSAFPPPDADNLRQKMRIFAAVGQHKCYKASKQWLVRVSFHAKYCTQIPHNQPWKGPLDGGLPGLRSKESDCTHVEQEDANGMELN